MKQVEKKEKTGHMGEVQTSMHEMNTLEHGEEQGNYEMNVIENCKDQPKLFHRYVYSKLEKERRNKKTKGGW